MEEFIRSERRQGGNTDRLRWRGSNRMRNRMRKAEKMEVEEDRDKV